MTKETTAADDLPSLREVIRAMGLTAKKSLGQNFLLDLNLTRRIARAAGAIKGRTVVEVGPGPGGLTRALLLAGADHVVAVERDERCLPALEAIAARFPGRLEILSGDALEVDWPRALGALSRKALIVANLPYAVSTKLLVGWLETEPWPPWYERMLLMFQKEVAERIVAEPATKPYGRLAVISQWRTRPRIVLALKPEAFTPPPKVASAVVEFIPRAEPTPPCSVKILGELTAAAFGQRRKMLRVSLKQVVPEPDALLAAVGLPGEHRGEQLSVPDFARLATALGAIRAGKDR